jgi:hypothetical protein
MRNPTTVFFTVASVVVDAVNRHSRRTQAHVFKKAFEIHPSLANGDSSPTVPSPLVGLGVRTSLHHSIPGVVGWRVLPAFSVSVRLKPLRRLGASIWRTSARRNQSSHQAVCKSGLEFSATACAKPCHALSLVSGRALGPFKNLEEAERLPGQVFCFCHVNPFGAVNHQRLSVGIW